MRKAPVVLIATFTLLAALSVSAEGQERTWSFFLGAGPSFPMGDLGDEVETSYHLLGAVGYQPASLPVGLRLDLLYQDFDAVEREPSIHVARDGEWYRQLSTMLSVTLPIAGSTPPVRPYGLLGAGWFREWHDDVTYSGEQQTTISGNVGIGADVALFGYVGFVEARYIRLLGGDELVTGPPAIHPAIHFRSIPVTFGLRF